MRVWRLARAVVPSLDNEDARIHCGHWSSRRSFVVYASAWRALAVLERRVRTGPEDVPSDLTRFEIEIPETAKIATVSAADLDRS